MAPVSGAIDSRYIGARRQTSTVIARSGRRFWRRSPSPAAPVVHSTYSPSAAPAGPTPVRRSSLSTIAHRLVQLRIERLADRIELHEVRPRERVEEQLQRQFDAVGNRGRRRRPPRSRGRLRPRVRGCRRPAADCCAKRSSANLWAFSTSRCARRRTFSASAAARSVCSRACSAAERRDSRAPRSELPRSTVRGVVLDRSDHAGRRLGVRWFACGHVNVKLLADAIFDNGDVIRYSKSERGCSSRSLGSDDQL